MLAHGFGAGEKQAQLACFTLNNIFQLGGAEVMRVFGRYERVLSLVSFNDENLSPVTSGMLFALSGRRGDAEEEAGRENVAVTNMRMHLRNEI